jgi:hypothetical protein
MELRPDDLGTTLGGAVIKRRGGQTDARAERQQSLTMALTSAAGSGIILGTSNPLYGIIVGALTGTATYLLLPRWRRKLLLETPVSAAELQRLRGEKIPQQAVPLVPTLMDTIFTTLLGQPLPQPPQKHTLEDAYFELLSEIQALNVAQVETEAELRGTLRALSEAVASLPPTAPVEESEIVDLVVDAEGLLFKSQREKDPIIAASLHRQAEAAVRRARALKNAAQLARRTRTLREEVYRQIGALRASLPAYTQASQSIATGRIQELAHSVNQVAQDAASVVAAQEELAQTLTPEWRVQTTQDDLLPQVQRLGQ